NAPSFMMPHQSRLLFLHHSPSNGAAGRDGPRAARLILSILPFGGGDQDASNCAHATSTARYDCNQICLVCASREHRRHPDRRRHHNTTGSRYVPNTSFKAMQISPNVALAFTASRRYGITFSPHEAASCSASTAPAIL